MVRLIDLSDPVRWSQAKRHALSAEPPNLVYLAQVPESDLGEQLVAQWIGCIANQSWFFKYGRVQLSLVVRPTLYDVSYLR